MTTIYDSDRMFFLDDETGRLWDSENRKVEFDPVSRKIIQKIEKVVVEPEVVEVVTIPEEETTVTADTVQTVVTEVTQEPLFCKECGFVAKTYAGLQVHKFKKHQR